MDWQALKTSCPTGSRRMPPQGTTKKWLSDAIMRCDLEAIAKHAKDNVKLYTSPLHAPRCPSRIVPFQSMSHVLPVSFAVGRYIVHTDHPSKRDRTEERRLRIVEVLAEAHDAREASMHIAVQYTVECCGGILALFQAQRAVRCLDVLLPRLDEENLLLRRSMGAGDYLRGYIERHTPVWVAACQAKELLSLGRLLRWLPQSSSFPAGWAWEDFLLHHVLETLMAIRMEGLLPVVRLLLREMEFRLGRAALRALLGAHRRLLFVALDNYQACYKTVPLLLEMGLNPRFTDGAGRTPRERLILLRDDDEALRALASAKPHEAWPDACRQIRASMHETCRLLASKEAAARERELAFAMLLHPRLGRRSMWRGLEGGLIACIALDAAHSFYCGKPPL